MLRTRAAEARRRRLKKYDLEPRDFERMLNEQGGVCAVCQQVESVTQGGEVQSLSVDHDHETGRVRGLLCSRCNASLGLLREDPAVIMRLALYAARA